MRQCRPEARQMPPEDCPLSGIWSADRAFPTLRRRDSNAFNWRDRGLLFRHRDVRFQRTAKSGSVADMGAQTCRLACLLGCPLMEFRCGRLNDRNGGAKQSFATTFRCSLRVQAKFAQRELIPGPGDAHRQVGHANRRLDLVLGTWARLLMPSSAQQAELIAY